MLSAEKRTRISDALSRNSIQGAPALASMFLLSLILFSTSAAATELQNIEEIDGLGQEDLNITANTTFENNRIFNISRIEINSGFQTEGYTFRESQSDGNFPILTYDEPSAEWQVRNSDLDLQSNNISSVDNIESFFGACSADNVVTGVNSDGTVNCVDPEAQNRVENLSKTLESGNIANQSIDMNNNPINDLSSVDGGGNSISIDDNLNLNSNTLTSNSGELELDYDGNKNNNVRLSSVNEAYLALDDNDNTGNARFRLGEDGANPSSSGWNDLLVVTEGGNVNIASGNLDLSSDIRNSGDTVLYDQSTGEIFSTPGTTSGSNPVLTRSGDQNSGIGFSGTDQVSVITSGSEAIRATSGQNVELPNGDLGVRTSGPNYDLSLSASDTGIEGGNDQVLYASGTERIRLDNSQNRVEVSNGNLSLSNNYLVDVKQINLTSGTTIDGSFDIENSNITLNENYLKNATGVSTDRLYAPGTAGEVNLQDNLEVSGNEIQSNDGSEFTIADLSQIDDGFTVQGDVDLAENNLTSVQGINSDGTTTNIDLKDSGKVLIDNGNLNLSQNEIEDAQRIELQNGGSTGYIAEYGGDALGINSEGNILRLQDATSSDVSVESPLDVNENSIENINDLRDSTGSSTINFDGSNNVEISSGNLELSSDVETTGGTLIYDQSAGEYLANPGSTSSTNPVFVRNGDSDTGLGYSANDELVLITNGNAGPLVDSSQNLDIQSSNVENAEEFSGASGTSGDPLYTFDSDSNSGAFSPGSDQYGISTGGISAIEVDGSQNVQVVNGDLQLNSNNITGVDRVDSVNLDNPANAIEINSGGQYQVIANSLNDDEISDDSLTNGSIDSSGSFSISDLEVTSDLTGTGIVNTNQISDDAVTTAKIGADQVQTGNINNGAVQSEQIQDNEVNNTDIANSDSFTVNGLTSNSNIDLSGNQIIKIGSGATNFTSSGGLTAGDTLNANNNDIQNAPQLQNTGNVDLDIDSDSNTNDRTFDITHDGGAESIARFNESGDVGIPNGDLDMNGNQVADIVSDDPGDAVNQSYVKQNQLDGTFLQRTRQGRFRITGTGTIEVSELAFQPDSIRFTAQAPIQDSNTEGAASGGDNTDNFAGTMTGYARQGDSGVEQFAMSSGGSGNSINNIRQQSTEGSAIALTYGDQNGNEIGSVQATLDSFDGDGFTINVNEFNLDESGLVIQYQAYRASNYTNNNGTDVSEDGTLVKEDAADINFERNVDVQPDGEGGVNVDTEPEGIKQTLNVDNTVNTTVNMNGNDISNVNQISGDSSPVQVSNDVSMTGSSPKIDLGNGNTIQRTGGDVVISD